MARPTKASLDYFPLDVNFFNDRKIRLIRSGYGARGIMVVLAAFCLIYADNGYYTSWTEEDEALMADEVGCGCTPQLVHEVVQGCCQRSIFDGRVLAEFGVLTSRGIQHRYLKAVAKRDSITIIDEYWLLGQDDLKDIPTSTLNKVTFRRISGEKTGVSGEETGVSGETTPQSKVKESKVKTLSNESVLNGGKAAGARTRKRRTAPTLEEVTEYCRQRGNRVDPQRFCDYYGARGWMLGGTPVGDWKALVRTWESGRGRPAERAAQPAAAMDYAQRSYAPGELERVCTDIMSEVRQFDA